jgi:hypothetical protein
MGNATSKPTNKPISEINENKNKNVDEIMDYIATNYILSMDFESLKQLYNKNYCDNLIVLTSDIIEKYFTNTDITYLSDRIMKKDNVVFVNRNDLETIDELDTNKKSDLCNGIAKFYITIAHIFSSIITTVNPVYIFTNLNGEVKKISLNDRNKIPYGVKTQIIKYNICDNRINSLRNNSLLDKDTGDLTINPSVCNVNLKDDGNLKTLEDEPGIPELLDLYNDDNYNFETGTFDGMSESTRAMFQENLKVFYTTFTGNEEMPPEIQKFSDIHLRDYNKDGMCQSRLDNSVSGNISNELFMKYAENLKEMISKTNKNRDSLMEILNDLFVYFIDEETQSKRIRINPKLNEDNLKDVVIKTRSAIIKLYLTCEQDYVEGIKIYEAIVEQKILETSQNQINSLKKMSQNLISTDENIILPEDKIIEENLEKEKILEEAEEKIGEIEQLQSPIPPLEEQPTQEIQEQIIPPQPSVENPEPTVENPSPPVLGQISPLTEDLPSPIVDQSQNIINSLPPPLVDQSQNIINSLPPPLMDQSQNIVQNIENQSQNIINPFPSPLVDQSQNIINPFPSPLVDQSQNIINPLPLPLVANPSQNVVNPFPSPLVDQSQNVVNQFSPPIVKPTPNNV